MNPPITPLGMELREAATAKVGRVSPLRAASTTRSSRGDETLIEEFCRAFSSEYMETVTWLDRVDPIPRSSSAPSALSVVKKS